jgi:hypothetical protein
MQMLAMIFGWVLALFGVAIVAVVLESLLYRRRSARERALHQSLGVGSPDWQQTAPKSKAR